MSGSRTAPVFRTSRVTVGLRPAVLPVFAWLAIVVSPAVAQEVGRFLFIQGDVSITRDGDRIDTDRLFPGDALFQYDVVETGADGYAEVELTAAGRAVLRVRENTTYYVEADDADQPGTTVRLFGGRASATVESVRSGAGFQIRTQTATLGVRGTEFETVVSPDEATLLGVREGLVEISVDDERPQSVSEGRVAEAVPGQPIGVETPDGDLDAFVAGWQQRRLAIFRAGAATFVQAYAQRYRETLPVFRSAYEELLRFEPDLRAAAESGARSLGEDMRLRTAASPALIRMRSVVPLFEETVYRLKDLERFHAEGVGRTTVGGAPSTRFFLEFNRDVDSVTRQLSRVRTLFRLYAAIEERSFGGLPSGESLFGGDSLQPGSLRDAIGN